MECHHPWPCQFGLLTQYHMWYWGRAAYSMFEKNSVKVMPVWSKWRLTVVGRDREGTSQMA